MFWCDWCRHGSIEAKYQVTNAKGVRKDACGNHLGRAVDFFVFPEGKVTVRRLK